MNCGARTLSYLYPHMPEEKQPSTSEFLHALSEELSDAPISLRSLSERLHERAFGLVLLLFSLPCAFSLGIPGIASVFAVPIALVGWQMLRGQTSLTLPEKLAERTLSGSGLKKALHKSLRPTRFLEKLFRPRLSALLSPKAERLIGLLVLLLAGLIFLPIPFGDPLPASCLFLLAFGLIERDGLAVAIGASAGVLCLAFMGLVLPTIVLSLL